SREQRLRFALDQRHAGQTAQGPRLVRQRMGLLEPRRRRAAQDGVSGRPAVENRKRDVSTLEPRGQRVLVRVDFNVPLKDGHVADDTRITASLPTLKWLVDRGGRVVLMSHLGRPKGGPEPKYSLRPVATRLAERLGRPVAFATDCVGPAAEAA